jgi:hypothetical protein
MQENAIVFSHKHTKTQYSSACSIITDNRPHVTVEIPEVLQCFKIPGSSWLKHAKNLKFSLSDLVLCSKFANTNKSGRTR